MAGAPIKRARTDRWTALMNDPATLRDICDFVAEGHSLVEWVRAHDVRYGDVWSWIIADDRRQELYAKALEGRGEFLNELVVRNLRQLADVDIGELFYGRGKKKGQRKPMHELSPALRRAIVAIEADGKIKLVSPKDATELLGKYRKLFVEQHAHTGKLTLEELVGGSMPAKPEAPA